MPTQDNLSIQSPVFNRGGMIPDEYTPKGSNISPPLKIENVPPQTKELVLICEDPDAPGDKPYVHWLVYGLSPEQNELPAGIFTRRKEATTFPFREGLNSAGHIGYTGPRPPSGTHHYLFKLFALNKNLTLPAGQTVDEVMREMEGHVIAEADYVGLQIH